MTTAFFHKKTKHQPAFSIIIPTLNEEKYLPRLLEDLKTQTFSDFEIIHVDAQSQDNTQKIAQKYSSSLDIKTLTSQKKNVSFQRNFGAKQAQADWIIFMDADNLLPNYFLQGIKYQIDKNSKIDSFTCWLDTSNYPVKYRPTAQLINFGLSIFNNAALGSLLGVKKRVLKKVNFNEKTPYVEDSEFAKNIEEAGFVFTCLKEPRYTYSMRRLEKEGTLKVSKTLLESRLYLLAKGDMENFKKYPMLGGDFYENDSDKFTNFMKKVDLFLKKATVKQLKNAKKIWEFVTEDY